MADEVKQKTYEELQAEYQNLCTKAGHGQFQILTLQKELDLVNNALRDLNIEALKVLQARKEADEKAQEASKLSVVKEGEQNA